MITDDILLEHGYKRFNDSLYNAQALFQKKIKDKKGIKYFIDIYKYTFKVKNYIPEYEIRLVSETDNYAINISVVDKDVNLNIGKSKVKIIND